MASPRTKKFGHIPDGNYLWADIESDPELRGLLMYRHPRRIDTLLGVRVKDGTVAEVITSFPKEAPRAESIPLEAPPGTGVWSAYEKDGKKVRREVFPYDKFLNGIIPSQAVLDGWDLKEYKRFLRGTLGFHRVSIFRMRRKDCDRLVEWSRHHLEDYWAFKEMQTDDD